MKPYLLYALSVLLLLNGMFGIYKYGYEEGYADGVFITKEEYEIATGHFFEDVLPNRIEPLCWKILTEKYVNDY